METKRKTYDELTFTDDFMFCEVLRNHPELCQELAELMTDRKILEIHLPEAQRQEKFLYEGKGVRFDVTFEDEAHTEYDIEMQTVLKAGLSRRSRYYSSMIDMYHLKRGTEYSKLPDSYIVFICLEDPFKKDIARYTFRETCEELPDYRLEDGRTTIFINSKSPNGASPELIALFDYLNGKAPASDLTKAIEQAVLDQKDSEEGRIRYMTLEEHYKEEREIGIEIGTEKGIEIGREKERSEMIQNAVTAGKSVEQIADFLGISVKEVQQLSQL
ncbi:MAG: Rpn family recombination-promoting nuclease/putative transposase [Lachnospiraceae bacterium]|nr:Rpn family recombination-promoting nuclease/putative transposase [Lachnospiraceae bacterium]